MKGPWEAPLISLASRPSPRSEQLAFSFISAWPSVALPNWDPYQPQENPACFSIPILASHLMLGILLWLHPREPFLEVLAGDGAGEWLDIRRAGYKPRSRGQTGVASNQDSAPVDCGIFRKIRKLSEPYFLFCPMEITVVLSCQGSCGLNKLMLAEAIA